LKAKPEMLENLREETLRTRIMVADALCAIAQSAAHGGMSDRAVENLVHVRHILAEVSVYANDVNRIPADAAEELLGFVRELHERAQEMESVLQMLKPGFAAKESAAKKRRHARRVRVVLGNHREIPLRR
jgi:hypothetical protein